MMLTATRGHQMRQDSKMTLKNFVEEYTKILNMYDSEQLKSILISMANDVDPKERTTFITKLILKQSVKTEWIMPGKEILEEIDSLIEDIRAQSEEEPDWSEYDDEDDTLGEFAEFIPSLHKLFNDAEALFNNAECDNAQKAYATLFTIFEIQDDYGRGISIHDLENFDFDEASARYLRSVYLSEKPGNRVNGLLKAMTQLSNIDYIHPKLDDVINISIDPLPEFNLFLEEWIQVIKSKKEPEFDDWYREAIFLLQGVSGLETIAKNEGVQRPKIYFDWANALIKDKNYEAALDAIHYALEQLPKNKPIRADVGELKIICGVELNNKAIQFQGQWTSFESKPDLSKLINLYHKVELSKKTALMQEASLLINQHKQNTSNSIEGYSRPTASLQMHAYLLSNQQEQAFKLAQENSPLGWSSDENAQPLFIAYCLVRLTNQPIHKLPTSIKNIFTQALDKSKGIWLYDQKHQELLKRLECAYETLFATSDQIPNEVFDWCLKIAQSRVHGIVSNQHRRAYDRAALLTAACAATLKYINPGKAILFFNEIKNAFPRHSSFQAELRKHELSL